MLPQNHLHASSQEFCEECETRYRTVRRDPELVDNRLLPGAFQRVAGDRIYHALRNGFPRADGEVKARSCSSITLAWIALTQ